MQRHILGTNVTPPQGWSEWGMCSWYACVAIIQKKSACPDNTNRLLSVSLVLSFMCKQGCSVIKMDSLNGIWCQELGVHMQHVLPYIFSVRRIKFVSFSLQWPYLLPWCWGPLRSKIYRKREKRKSFTSIFWPRICLRLECLLFWVQWSPRLTCCRLHVFWIDMLWLPMI